ncbi:hypothetical protein [Phaeobacter inhibens]|uniref:hypothetical protein n=1 Tax=Phaeobacter inhibens TaxID=221822 RepID=UPI0021A7807D|nr:hypothetical protein [Phaeobacter inhibens]UWR62786.1 hypothetical protein K4F88_19395 [Phaeobacter inhibens]
MDQAQQHELDMISDLRKRSARWKLGAIGVTAITIFTALIPFISVTNGGAFQTVP